MMKILSDKSHMSRDRSLRMRGQWQHSSKPGLQDLNISPGTPCQTEDSVCRAGYHYNICQRKPISQAVFLYEPEPAFSPMYGEPIGSSVVPGIKRKGGRGDEPFRLRTAGTDPWKRDSACRQAGSIPLLGTVSGAWTRLRVVLLLLNLCVLLIRARLALRFGGFYGRTAKGSVHVEGF